MHISCSANFRAPEGEWNNVDVVVDLALQGYCIHQVLRKLMKIPDKDVVSGFMSTRLLDCDRVSSVTINMVGDEIFIFLATYGVVLERLMSSTLSTNAEPNLQSLTRF